MAMKFGLRPKGRQKEPSDETPAGRGAPSAPSFTNAFHPDFLAWLAELDLPSTSGEAAHRGPWKVEAETAGADARFAVLRTAENLAQGDPPRLLLEDRQDALLAAAALPAMGSADAYRLGTEPDRSGDPMTRDQYILFREDQRAGHCRTYDHELLAYLHALRTLCTHPEALAHLLEAAGREALVRAGRILANRMEELNTT